MGFKSGDDVLVTFDDGEECPGEVMSVAKSGFVICHILVDPTDDWGSLDARRGVPYSTVCVRSTCVRHRE